MDLSRRRGMSRGVSRAQWRAMPTRLDPRLCVFGSFGFYWFQGLLMVFVGWFPVDWIGRSGTVSGNGFAGIKNKWRRSTSYGDFSLRF